MAPDTPSAWWPAPWQWCALLAAPPAIAWAWLLLAHPALQCDNSWVWTKWILISPALEELAFRGLLQSALMRGFGRMQLPRWAAIAIAALAFAAFHGVNGAAAYSLAMFAAGLAFGYVYSQSRNLIYPILLHAWSNACLLLIGCALS
jgi:membrane protease YdiL (CAAX protease family)